MLLLLSTRHSIDLWRLDSSRRTDICIHIFYIRIPSSPQSKIEAPWRHAQSHPGSCALVSGVMEERELLLQCEYFQSIDVMGVLTGLDEHEPFLHSALFLLMMHSIRLSSIHGSFSRFFFLAFLSFVFLSCFSLLSCPACTHLLSILYSFPRLFVCPPVVALLLAMVTSFLSFPSSAFRRVK